MQNSFNVSRTYRLFVIFLLWVLSFTGKNAFGQTRAVYFVGYNSNTATFPIAAAGVNTSVVNSGSINYNGLTTYNDNRCVWTNPNASTTLNTATAPYLSYTINFVSGNITLDRFVMCGLAQFGTAKLQLRWSVDAFASSLGEFTINGGSYTLSSVVLSSKGNIAVSGNIVFRVYFYNNATTIFNSDTGPYSSLDGTPSSYGAYGQNVALWYTAFSGLPLTWLSFDALKQNDQVLLQWSTASEQNTRNFTVQRSADGIQWTNTGVVQAAGNSTTTKNYSFVDNNPLKGFNYYRMLQTDLDDRSSYSKVVTLNFNDPAAGPEILGNPVTGGNLQLRLNEPLLISLYDEQGRLLLKKQLQSGIQLIDVSRYAKGMYTIQGNGQAKNFFILK